MTLALLAGYQPTLSAVVLDAAQQRPGDGSSAPDGLEPYCTSCGEPVGIFLGHGTDWRHFRRAGEACGKPEVYEAGHVPAAGWRVVAASR